MLRAGRYVGPERYARRYAAGCWFVTGPGRVWDNSWGEQQSSDWLRRTMKCYGGWAHLYTREGYPNRATKCTKCTKCRISEGATLATAKTFLFGNGHVRSRDSGNLPQVVTSWQSPPRVSQSHNNCLARRKELLIFFCSLIAEVAFWCWEHIERGGRSAQSYLAPYFRIK